MEKIVKISRPVRVEADHRYSRAACAWAQSSAWREQLTSGGKTASLAQARQCANSIHLQKIERALIEAGASLQNVTRTRIFMTDITQWESVGTRARRSLRRDPARHHDGRSFRLIGEEYLVEIEADAILDA
jgi:enamine deaminase RidA (YjgF/YER057c/UK114 family)